MSRPRAVTASPVRTATSCRFARCALLLVVPLIGPSIVTALTPEVLKSTGAIPAHIAGRFRDVQGFEQSAFGQYFVFDRRGHRVYGIDEQQTSAWQIVQLGPEQGRIIEPTAFSLAPDGTFVVADMPEGQGRIQVFTPVGFRIGGFLLSKNTRPHITYQDVLLSGIASLHYSGSSILLSQPETGALVSEYNLRGQIVRTFGELRATGHEDDRDVHLAFNTGIPLATPDGGFLFVFRQGPPAFRRFDANGQLLQERRMEGREIDDVVAKLPTAWSRRAGSGEFPIVPPMVKAAAVDRQGNLWVSFVVPYTYVYDRDGDKTRAVQFRAAGLLSPSSLFFGPRGRVLVTPGLFEFNVGPQPRGEP